MIIKYIVIVKYLGTTNKDEEFSSSASKVI